MLSSARKSGLLAAAGAILLWSSLAGLVSKLSAVPPFLLTGLALILGSLVSLPRWRQWQVSGTTIVIGAAALFFYHLLLFMALRWAPPVSANLLNYLWPLLIVVLSPLFDARLRLDARALLAAMLGFVGAALAILSRPMTTLSAQAWLGFFFAVMAAVLWASYSLLLRRLPPFSSWAVGGFALLAGLGALLAHGLWEPQVSLSASDWPWLLLLGFGPMGLAFVLWDVAMKRADPRIVGVLAYATPVLSTLFLLHITGQPLSLSIAFATALVVVAGLLCWRKTD